jgi:hypothetical protein
MPLRQLQKVDSDVPLSCVLELKSGTISVSGVVGQLQQAALIVDQLLGGTTVRFLPVLVHEAIPTVTLRKLKDQTINFRGAKMRIHRIKGGGAVENLKWSLAIRRPRFAGMLSTARLSLGSACNEYLRLFYQETVAVPSTALHVTPACNAISDLGCSRQSSIVATRGKPWQAVVGKPWL